MAKVQRLADVATDPKPSVSTVVSVALGAPLGTVVVWLIGLSGVVVPAEVASAIGALLGALVGYFFPGGLSIDTK